MTTAATIRNPNARRPAEAQTGAVYLPTRIHPVVTAVNTILSYRKPFWLGASTVTAVMIVFGTVNYGAKPRLQPVLQQQASLTPVFSSVKETVVYRAPEQRQSFQDRWEQARVFFSEAETEATDEERLDQTGSVQTGSVQTVRAKNPMVQVATAEDKIGALAFAPPTTPATFSLASATSEPISLGTKSEPVGRATMESLHEAATSPEAKALSGLDEVERYLWEVYQRAPVKKDGSGDFTWKDPVAAKRFGKSMPAYVIGGMDPDFKEQLYHAGKAMDAAGVQWAILSAFRDDYRQSLASGFKASARNSLHGGSARVGGYGHGRAVDVTALDGNPEPVWKWLDAHGGKYGLHRPMPGNDPAHVQSRGDWRKLAQALRASRTQIAQARTAKTKGKVATAAAR